jgi:hypothetical protein
MSISALGQGRRLSQPDGTAGLPTAPENALCVLPLSSKVAPMRANAKLLPDWLAIASRDPVDGPD